MVGTVSAMGLGTSGVRRIAEANGRKDEEGIALTVRSLRRVLLISGILGMAVMIPLSPLLSLFSFGSHDHAAAIAVLSLTLPLTNMATVHLCLLQGKRRIRELARAGVIGAFNGTVISVPCYYFWGVKGIVPSLLLICAVTLAISRWFARHVTISSPVLPWRDIRRTAVDLVRAGIPFMMTALLIALSGYIIRILVIQRFGLEGVGIWQAAFTLSAVLISLLLNAMGTDYYPRLSALAHDLRGTRESVNTQTEIALLLAVPGLITGIVFAPLVINIFYSGRFDAAADILRWSLYGVFMRVVSWPLSFLLPARGMGKTHFLMEVVVNVTYVAATWFGLQWQGLPGTGAAFFLMCLVQTILLWGVGYAVAGVTWSVVNLAHIAGFGLLLAAAGAISALIAAPWQRFGIGTLLLAGTGAYCMRRLSRQAGVGWNDLLRRFGRGNPGHLKRREEKDHRP
jgi:PST family polysaccharide transporter